MIHLYSYGAKHNEKALGSMVLDRVFPCHNIVNPYNTTLKSKTGLDSEVQDLVWSDATAKRILNTAVSNIVDDGATKIAFECYGGRHRSVAMAEILAEFLSDFVDIEVEIHHLSLGRYV